MLTGFQVTQGDLQHFVLDKSAARYVQVHFDSYAHMNEAAGLAHLPHRKDEPKARPKHDALFTGTTVGSGPPFFSASEYGVRRHTRGPLLRVA